MNETLRKMLELILRKDSVMNTKFIDNLVKGMVGGKE